MLTATRKMTKVRPTTSSSVSEGRVRTSGQMSIVNIVEEELKMEVREDISAAIITASIRPRAPVVDIILLNHYNVPSYALLTLRHEREHELDVCDVCAPGLRAADRLALDRVGACHLAHRVLKQLVYCLYYYFVNLHSDLVSEEDPGGHAGEHQEEEREELKEGGEDAARLGVADVLGRQRPLHDHLVRAPVPDGAGNNDNIFNNLKILLKS